MYLCGLLKRKYHIMIAWKSFFSSKTRLIQFSILAILCLSLVFVFTRFMEWNETRSGMVFNDPILKLFNPIDLSTVISIFTLVPIFLGLIYIFRKPTTTVYFFIAAIVICCFRALTLYLLPLEPPINIIPLTDPVIETLFYGGHVLLKDLFFSGHTANLILIGLIVEQRRIKNLLFISGFLVGSMVMIQHVHYSIDVLAAPFFSFVTYRISIWVGNGLIIKDFKIEKA